MPILASPTTATVELPVRATTGTEPPGSIWVDAETGAIRTRVRATVTTRLVPLAP